MGAGAVVGGLIAAHRAKPTPRLLQVLALVFGGLLAAVALAPTLLAADLLIVLMGAASIGFIATANATLQLTADPAMRGRVMALYAMAFLGTTPIGAPLVGAIAQWTEPPGGPARRCGGHRAVGRAADVAPPGPPADRRRAPTTPRIHLVEVQAVEETESEPAGRLSRPQPAATALGSFGRPSTRSPTMLRWISAVPPQMVSDREKKNEACRSLTG